MNQKFMGCMTLHPRVREQLQMHTVVTQPMTAHDTGRIACHPMGLEPIRFEWSGECGSLRMRRRAKLCTCPRDGIASARRTQTATVRT